MSLDFDQARAVRLLAELVQQDTSNPPGAERLAAELLAAELERCGLAPEITEVAPGRTNLTARLTGGGETPALVFNGHLDVVPPGELPWSHPPFAAEVHDGRLYGRGASDMKSGLAAMAVAFGTLARSRRRLRGDLIFTAVADEEVGALGARAIARSGLLRQVGAVVIGEPTGFKVYVAEKGLYWLELETVGRTAHGSMPHLGRNAIVDMHAVLDEVLGIPLPQGSDPAHGESSLNIGTIHGGVGPNVVPDLCRATLDLRLPPGASFDAVCEAIESAVARAAVRRPGLQAHVRTLGRRPAVSCEPSERIVQIALQLCEELLGVRQMALPTPGYATDASELCSDPPLPFVIVGPGDEELAHRPDESVELASYLQAIPFYAELAERYL